MTVTVWAGGSNESDGQWFDAVELAAEADIAPNIVVASHPDIASCPLRLTPVFHHEGMVVSPMLG